MSIKKEVLKENFGDMKLNRDLNFDKVEKAIDLTLKKERERVLQEIENIMQSIRNNQNLEYKEFSELILQDLEDLKKRIRDEKWK